MNRAPDDTVEHDAEGDPLVSEGPRDDDPIIQPIATPVIEYRPIAGALARLRHEFQGRAYDLATVKGNDEARRDRKRLVSLRTGLEKLRLDSNRIDRESIAERIKIRDDEAKRITEQIAEFEKPIDDQIKADEARREEERLAKIEAERARQASIRERIALIANVLRRSIGRPSYELQTKIELVQAQTIDAETFAEFASEAAIVKDDTLTQLRELLQATQQAEIAAAALAVQRAENERRAAELAKQEAEASAERKRQREAEAERQRILDAEAVEQRRAVLADLEKQIAARNAEHEAQLAEQRAREAEQQRREAEQAEEQRKAERAQREAEQRLHGQAQAMFNLLVEAIDESFVSPRAKNWKARTEQVIALVYGT